MPPEKKKLFQLVNMLHIKPIMYNIKNMLISDMYSQNQNVQYHEVQITNIFFKGYPFSCTRTSLKAGFMAVRFLDEIVVAFMAYNMHSYQITT